MLLEDKLDHIFGLYINYGNVDYIGETVSQTEHMVQAAMLAEKENSSFEIILAALFHDIGQLINIEQTEKYGNKEHEKIGAEYLRNMGIPYPIPELVYNHVKVKRYLTYKYPNYHSTLTNASKQTLLDQGGPMSLEEATEFENDPLFEASLKIRKFDDLAKDPSIQIKPIEYYRSLCYSYLIQVEAC
jgi:2-amino-1-hydroxyethylphosphonate dioxygenase (glycine-forming)